jgi:hypothetical protein
VCVLNVAFQKTWREQAGQGSKRAAKREDKQIDCFYHHSVPLQPRTEDEQQRFSVRNYDVFDFH